MLDRGFYNQAERAFVRRAAVACDAATCIPAMSAQEKHFAGPPDVPVTCTHCGTTSVNPVGRCPYCHHQTIYKVAHATPVQSNPD